MKLKYTFELVNLDDEIVAVPIDASKEEFRGIIKLNPSAEIIFKLLDNNITEDEIFDVLINKYDVAEDELRQYIHDFINKLNSAGLLEE